MNMVCFSVIWCRSIFFLNIQSVVFNLYLLRLLIKIVNLRLSGCKMDWTRRRFNRSDFCFLIRYFTLLVFKILRVWLAAIAAGDFSTGLRFWADSVKAVVADVGTGIGVGFLIKADAAANFNGLCLRDDDDDDLDVPSASMNRSDSWRST